MLTRVLAVVLVAVLALPLAAMTPGPPGAEAKSKRKLVTRTFTNNGFIAIPGAGDSGPANPYPATIEVGGFRKGKIKDVNLILHNYNHTNPNDVDVLLVAAQLPGRTATVMSDVGGGTAVVDVTLTLDDNGPLPLPLAGPIVSGTFQPTNDGLNDPFPPPAPVPNGNALLNVFKGGSPNGQWQLFVVDDLALDTGSFAGGWTLEIEAKVREKVKNKIKKGKRK